MSESRRVHIREDLSKRVFASKKNNRNSNGILDGGCDTSILGGAFRILSESTDRKVSIQGASNKMVQEGLPIATGATVVETKNRKYILIVNEGISIPDNDVSLISPPQLREYGVTVDDKARRHGEKQSIIADDIEIGFRLQNSLLVKELKHPTDKELENLQHITLTSDTPWDPTVLNDDDVMDYEDDDPEGEYNNKSNETPFDLGDMGQGLNLGYVEDKDYEQALIWIDEKHNSYVSKATKEIDLEKAQRCLG